MEVVTRGRQATATSDRWDRVRRLWHPVVLLVGAPAVGSLIPALVWLAFQPHSGAAVIGATMASLFATGRVTMRVLDRFGIVGMWTRLAWVMAATIVSLVAWGVILSAGEATYEPGASG
jgi:hypothetical protein